MKVRKVDIQVPIIAFTAAVYENMQTDLKEKGFTDLYKNLSVPTTCIKKSPSTYPQKERNSLASRDFNSLHSPPTLIIHP